MLWANTTSERSMWTKKSEKTSFWGRLMEQIERAEEQTTDCISRDNSALCISPRDHSSWFTQLLFSVISCSSPRYTGSLTLERTGNLFLNLNRRLRRGVSDADICMPTDVSANRSSLMEPDPWKCHIDNARENHPSVDRSQAIKLS